MSLPESGLTTENANRRPSGDQSPSRVPDCTAAPFSRRDSRSFPRGKLVGLVVASRHGGGGSQRENSSVGRHRNGCPRFSLGEDSSKPEGNPE